MTVRKIRKTNIRTRSTRTIHSRYGRRRKGMGSSSTMKAKYSRGKRTGIWSMIPFPRAVARFMGAKWADPRRR